MVSVELYDAACPRCGYKAGGLKVSDIEHDASQVSLLAVCSRCKQLLSCLMPPRRSSLLEYRNQVDKAVKHMKLARKRYLDNIKRRIEELEPRVHAGEATLDERARLSAAIDAGRNTGPADVEDLERTIELIDRALEHASDEPPSHSCGEPLKVCSETTSGYSIDCPDCGEEQLVVRLVERK